METSINERIVELFLDSKSKSKRSWALNLGIAPSTINDVLNGSDPRYTLLRAILDGNPSISAEWFMTGKGDKFKKDYAESKYTLLLEDLKSVIDKHLLQNRSDSGEKERKESGVA